MSNSNSSKLHIAMFPWFAFGHFIPYLHLSNKLAEKGHKISFLLPKGAQSKLENYSHCPKLIQFLPLVVPHVDGIPPGSKTGSDVPQQLHNLLAIAFDRTRDQVEAILRDINPDMVFYDLGYWIPALAQQSASSPYLKLKAEEAAAAISATISETFGIRLSLHERILISIKDSDVIAYRTYHEIEGPFCDYVAQHFGKRVRLTGPCLSETKANQLEEKWANWLSNFEPGSVVFCAFGSQTTLQKDDFQELVLGLELCGQPFLLADQILSTRLLVGELKVAVEVERGEN
ncbi:hypothetical protein PTKIN_Ptkin14bG0153000 [Pterospermum kingtungense]